MPISPLYSYLGLESGVSVSSYTVDEDMDDCRVISDPLDLNTIVTDIMR